ncbi:deoxyribodipyrimidine photolyase [Chryseobacterium sp. Leaf404]|uniref:DASH family cryptochrome n=1 Tax=unclassified Chryseobacterium TaxID=2593645 RepID=UPI0006F5174C|nr:MULTISPECIES: DASH family cryptochrome [unclassified Chryseobacterium]KQT18505.1 deoxyribodipyrimidine photolyase [Chryseobacterium sp. Leaf404]
MSEKQKINILWLNNNLRIRDNEALLKIQQEDLPFVALYIFDSKFYSQKQFGFKKTGMFRTKFLLETVLDVEKKLNQNGIPFLKKFGNTAEIFKQIAEYFDIETIFCQEEWTKDETDVQQRVEKALPKAVWSKSYSQLLLQPDFVYHQIEKIPFQFTTFRQKVEKNFTVRKEFVFNKTGNDLNFEIQVKSDEINLATLGFEDFENHRFSAFPFSGGETEALKRLNSYFAETENLSKYKETRNGMTGSGYSSKFSAWLANGSLSPISVYYEIKKYEAEFGSNESTYWLVFELLWREFFKYVSMENKDKIFQLKGISDKEYPFQSEDNVIQKWIAGKTESDFINANMLEIRQTGFMSNRGRQNVASYFCKILRQDWRIGAAYFEEMLVDYDLHSNYGNWMYLAGVGNDPRGRTFNPGKQAEQYDNDYKFRNLWLR